MRIKATATTTKATTTTTKTETTLLFCVIPYFALQSSPDGFTGVLSVKYCLIGLYVSE